jgi:hypothetical protein
VADAGSVDLVVYRVPVAEREAALEPVLSIRLPGLARGWTPSLDQCFEPGGRYAWSVGVEGEWSQASLFDVSAAPSPLEVEEALAVLRRYAETGSGQAHPEVVTGDAPRIQEGARPTQAPRGPGETAAHGPRLKSRQTLPGQKTGGRVPEPGDPAPVLGTASLTVDQQIHLGADSHFFKQGHPVLWEDSSNTAFGMYALASNTTGFQNTAIGRDALLSNNTGYRNTASGNYALLLNNDGHDNTASGYRALILNTASKNTAIGSRALQSNIAGSSNTAVGYRALAANSAGLNTAIGAHALELNTDGVSNTAIGIRALSDSSSGNQNTATGSYALRYNTEGSTNTANGREALRDNTEGNRNSAFGDYALVNNETGSRNSALGKSALLFNTSGSNNIGIGDIAGGYNVTGSNSIWIGYTGYTAGSESNTLRIGSGTGTGTFQQDRAFISGIRGITTGQSDAAAVLIDSAGQLGTISSSRRLKEDIRDMATASSAVQRLRPVTFRLKRPFNKGDKPLQYGLIAEEAAQVMPELVAYDGQGQPETVKYHILSSLLLNELQKQSREIQVHRWGLVVMLVAGVAVSVRRRQERG